MATAPPNNLFDERAPSVPLRQRQFVAVQPFFRVFVRRGAGVQTAKCQECHGDSGTTDDAGEGRSGRVVFVQRELGRLNSKCGSAQLGHAQCFGHALWSRSVPASECIVTRPPRRQCMAWQGLVRLRALGLDWSEKRMG